MRIRVAKQLAPNMRIDNAPLGPVTGEFITYGGDGLPPAQRAITKRSRYGWAVVHDDGRGYFEWPKAFATPEAARDALQTVVENTIGDSEHAMGKSVISHFR